MQDLQSKEVLKLLAAGDFILAFDTAEKAIQSGNTSPQMKHLSVLSLARSGATDQAIQRYDDLALGRLAETVRSASVKTDIRALWARLKKDKALSSAPEQRASLLAEAADAYEAVYRSAGGSYPAINAATLRLLAGDETGARKLAALARRALGREGTKKSYWGAATAAEARLVQNDVVGAAKDLSLAAEYLGRDYATASVTRHQLSLICAFHEIDPRLLDALTIPSVIHFSGHIVGERFRVDKVSAVRDAIREELARLNAGFGFGALAAGADILFAEELLKRGAELHIVLPFDIEEFKRVRVDPAGADWSKRFDQCMSRAASVDFATSDSFLGDRSLYEYSAKLGIGFALLRAHFLGSKAQQCVVWDGSSNDETSDIVSGATIWQKLHLPASVIDPLSGECRPLAQSPAPPTSAPAGRRSLKAMIFGDFKGFSKLQEHQIESFTSGVQGALAAVIKEHDGDIAFRNTWGDGLYLVVNSSGAAAHLALALQRAMRQLSLADLDLPPSLGLRLGAHFGPVFPVLEPITDRPNFVGTHVSRTARIEPITPEGAVYVTEAFAADIAADEARSNFTLAYVGNIHAAKGYGNLRMYALGEAAGSGQA